MLYCWCFSLRAVATPLEDQVRLQFRLERVEIDGAPLALHEPFDEDAMYRARFPGGLKPLPRHIWASILLCAHRRSFMIHCSALDKIFRMAKCVAPRCFRNHISCTVCANASRVTSDGVFNKCHTGQPTLRRPQTQACSPAHEREFMEGTYF